jgi:hypothetical protein
MDGTGRKNAAQWGVREEDPGGKYGVRRHIHASSTTRTRDGVSTVHRSKRRDQEGIQAQVLEEESRRRVNGDSTVRIWMHTSRLGAARCVPDEGTSDERACA